MEKKLQMYSIGGTSEVLVLSRACCNLVGFSAVQTDAVNVVGWRRISGLPNEIELSGFWIRWSIKWKNSFSAGKQSVFALIMQVDIGQ